MDSTRATRQGVAQRRRLVDHDVHGARRACDTARCRRRPRTSVRSGSTRLRACRCATGPRRRRRRCRGWWSAHARRRRRRRRRRRPDGARAARATSCVGMTPRCGEALGGEDLDLEHRVEAVLVAEERGHVLRGVAAESWCSFRLAARAMSWRMTRPSKVMSVARGVGALARLAERVADARVTASTRPPCGDEATVARRARCRRERRSRPRGVRPVGRRRPRPAITSPRRGDCGIAVRGEDDRHRALTRRRRAPRRARPSPTRAAARRARHRRGARATSVSGSPKRTLYSSSFGPARASSSPRRRGRRESRCRGAPARASVGATMLVITALDVVARSSTPSARRRPCRRCWHRCRRHPRA